jgi:phage terminase large subunit-like protein
MIAAPDFEKQYLAGLEVVRSRSAMLASPSVMDRFVKLPPKDREEIMSSLTKAERAELFYAWKAWARPKQDPPEAMLTTARIILWLMGRGAGKTRGAAERVKRRVYAGARTIGIIGPTNDDIERYMLGLYESDEGILNVFPKRHRPSYRSDKGTVVFHTGAVGYTHSAEKSEYRGPNLDTVWCDEIAMWRFLSAIWTNIELATRKPGALPIEILITTTPRRLRFLKELVIDPDCVAIHGITDENPHNDPRWLARMKRLHEGTRLGSQELGAEILGDDPDAFFYASVIDATRIGHEPSDLRVVISVDPAISTQPKNDETGILVMGDDPTGEQYVLADLSGRHKPEVWGNLVVEAHDQRQAIAVVCERNRGGDLVEANVRAAMYRRRGEMASRAMRIEMVQATRGKDIRAEPVSSLHVQGRIHFVGHGLKECEDEITSWNPKLGGRSPNRLDALVWGSYFLAGLSGEVKIEGRDAMAGMAEANARLRSAFEGPRKPGALNPLTALLPPLAGRMPPPRRI